MSGVLSDLTRSCPERPSVSLTALGKLSNKLSKSALRYG